MRVEQIRGQADQIEDTHQGHPTEAATGSLPDWPKPAPRAARRLVLRFREDIPVAGRIEMTWAGWRYSAAREEWSVVVTAGTDDLRHAEWARFKAAWNGRAPEPPAPPACPCE